MKLNFPRLLVSIFMCQLAGIIGSIATYPSIPGWYASLDKPWFTPPNWVFGPVWITLFTLMGVSLYMVWDKGLKKEETRTAIKVFGAQLSLNALWSILFFGLRNPLLAFIEILPLWISIAISMLLFYRISRPAGILLVPYLAWVSLASMLNYYMWILN